MLWRSILFLAGDNGSAAPPSARPASSWGQGLRRICSTWAGATSKQLLPDREGSSSTRAGLLADHRCRCHHRQRHEAGGAVTALERTAAASAAWLCQRHKSFGSIQPRCGDGRRGRRACGQLHCGLASGDAGELWTRLGP